MKMPGYRWRPGLTVVLSGVVLLFTFAKLVQGGRKTTNYYFTGQGNQYVDGCVETRNQFHVDLLYVSDWNKRKCCPATFTNLGSPFCQALLQPVDLSRTDDDGWSRPFRGRQEDGTMTSHPLLPDQFFYWWDTYCNNVGVYRMEPAVDKLEDYGSLELYTNRLRFQPEWIAQEGLSFCIVGSHYRRSLFSQWEPLQGFLPLAEKSFDIGNHVDPTDSTKLNRFDLPDPLALRKICGVQDSQNVWMDKTKLPESRFRNVWLGVQKVHITDGDRVLGTTTCDVPMPQGFEKRPAHPDWMPGKDCRNPYVVSVSMIETDGIFLHNYLHIKVSAEPTTQSGKNCPTGKIKLFMMEVRDQNGYPVGQFTDDVPCDHDQVTSSESLQCMNAATTCRTHHGSKMNQVPCMFSHPKSAVHPSIFMMSATSGESDATDPQTGSGTGGGTGPGGQQGQPDDNFCRNNQDPKQKEVEHKDNPNYVTEVHATWRFAQMDESWVSELHFATMIIEDDTPIQYYTSRLTHWDGVKKSVTGMEETPRVKRGQTGKEGCVTTGHIPCCWYYGEEPNAYRPGRLQLGLINSCVNETYNTNRPYGYSARYTVLKPTFHTKGGWDWFRGRYVSPKSVNCHASISYGKEFFYEHGEEPGQLPIRKTLKDLLNEKYTLQDGSAERQPPDWNRDKGYYNKRRFGNRKQNHKRTYELPDWHNLGVTKATDGRFWAHWYTGRNVHDPILKMFDSAHQDPIVLKNEFDDQPFREYFGSRYLVPKREPLNVDVEKLKETVVSHDHEFTLKDMASDPHSRCPCPFIQTTAAPELATKASVELEARSTHAINMMLGWMILVPVSFFCARFFKETFTKTFFLQEFWWYTMHVLCLLTALLFTFGGIYGLKYKRVHGEPYEYLWTDATLTHYYTGYITIALFIVHLILGPFRLKNLEYRIINIGLHWLFGWLIYLGGVTTILSSAAIPSGFLSCYTFGIYVVFLGFQAAFTVGMEWHMWRVDEEMHLDPPRAYFPSPMMRVFHRDAPHSRFRGYMLLGYCVGCFLFYVAMHVSMNAAEGEHSCFEPHAAIPEAEAVGP